MNCSPSNTNQLVSFSSWLGYDCFYIKPTDGTSIYSYLGSGSGRFQTDYWVKREKDEKSYCLQCSVRPNFGIGIRYRPKYRYRSRNFFYRNRNWNFFSFFFFQNFFMYFCFLGEYKFLKTWNWTQIFKSYLKILKIWQQV